MRSDRLWGVGLLRFASSVMVQHIELSKDPNRLLNTCGITVAPRRHQLTMIEL